MALVKTSSFNGGAFFKPAEHMLDLALLIEPKSITRDVPYTDFNKKPGLRNEVIADISVFANQDALNKGEPTEFIGNAKVTHGMLTDNLSKFIGDASIAVLQKIPTQGGSGYVFRDPSDEATAAVTAYYEGREAALAAALGDVPDFD